MGLSVTWELWTLIAAFAAIVGALAALVILSRLSRILESLEKQHAGLKRLQDSLNEVRSLNLDAAAMQESSREVVGEVRAGELLKRDDAGT